MLPVHVTGGVLHVRAAGSVHDQQALETLRMYVGAYDVIAEQHPDTVAHLLVAYAARTMRSSGLTASGSTSPQGTFDAVAALDALLDLAIGNDASDLHLLPTSKGLRVRQRIDGDLHDVTDITGTGTETGTTAAAATLVARVKVRASLDVAERRLPQDGRFSHAVPGGSVDVRVATMPTRFGERVTLRLLPDGPSGVDLEGLGLSDATLRALERAVARDDGLVLLCGPTGSGKTTTLHALLARLAGETRSIVTLEDPIERIVDGTSQTQVDAAHGLGFVDGLRHLLRHDPDVLLVGEVRDRETARLAVEAAHTGHLVLSSLHAVDAPGALTRLSELGVAAPMLAETVRVVVAQRLLALPCPGCDGTGARGGCTSCAGTGTRGRRAVAETLELDEELRTLLRDGHGPATHHAALAAAVSPRLREAALGRVADGLARHTDAMRATPDL